MNLCLLSRIWEVYLHFRQDFIFDLATIAIELTITATNLRLKFALVTGLPPLYKLQHNRGCIVLQLLLCWDPFWCVSLSSVSCLNYGFFRVIGFLIIEETTITVIAAIISAIVDVSVF